MTCLGAPDRDVDAGCSGWFGIARPDGAGPDWGLGVMDREIRSTFIRESDIRYEKNASDCLQAVFVVYM